MNEHVVVRLQNEKGIISSVTLMEIRYRFLRKYGREKADQVINIIKSFKNLEIVPVTNGVDENGIINQGVDRVTIQVLIIAIVVNLKNFIRLLTEKALSQQKRPICAG